MEDGEAAERELSSLRRTFPNLEDFCRLKRDGLSEEIEVEGVGHMRLVKFLSVFSASLISFFLIFLISRWKSHPLVAGTGILGNFEGTGPLAYSLPIFLLTVPVLSLLISSVLLRVDWGRVRTEHKSSFRALSYSLLSGNSALEEAWRMRDIYWSLRKRRLSFLIPWRLLIPFILLSLIVSHAYLSTPAQGSIIRALDALVSGNMGQTSLDQVLVLFEERVDQLIKSSLEELLQKVNLYLGW